MKKKASRQHSKTCKVVLRQIDEIERYYKILKQLVNDPDATFEEHKAYQMAEGVVFARPCCEQCDTPQLRTHIVRLGKNLGHVLKECHAATRLGILRHYYVGMGELRNILATLLLHPEKLTNYPRQH